MSEPRIVRGERMKVYRRIYYKINLKLFALSKNPAEILKGSRRHLNKINYLR